MCGSRSHSQLDLSERGHCATEGEWLSWAAPENPSALKLYTDFLLLEHNRNERHLRLQKAHLAQSQADRPGRDPLALLPCTLQIYLK